MEESHDGSKSNAPGLIAGFLDCVPCPFDFAQGHFTPLGMTRVFFKLYHCQAWGDLYIREHPGIHQVHSRRASCAVPRDIVGRDGALRFYFGRDTVCETLLFKFCGQP